MRAAPRTCPSRARRLIAYSTCWIPCAVTLTRVNSSISARCSIRASAGLLATLVATLAATIVATLLLAGCAALPSSDPQPESIAAELERALSRAEQRGFAGQLLVMHGQEVLVIRGYGQRVPGQPDPLDASAVMPLASLTKPFTASAVLALAAEGRLGLDEPIGQHLPDLAAHWAAIPIAHFLTHTAGLPAEIINRAWQGPVRFEPVAREAFVRRLDHFQPDHPPGQRFNYSNIGYNLLAVLIETLAEEAFEEFLSGSLLATAGVVEIGLVVPDWAPERLVSGRQGLVDSGHFIDQPRLPDGAGWHLRGAGDLLATPAGIASWWQAIQSQTWLSQPWLETWLTPQVSAGNGSQYGYGWQFRDSRLGPVVGHTGQELDFTAALAWYRDSDLMVYINSADRRFRADRLLPE
ncbi:MAG: class A beta-lactamase-related serine hydrolase [Wenzhouxiangella sp.]|nr:MAG: class A beta-lactamase-related serine hydrolase [Wenzhouxiangella sp.]